MYQIQRNGKKTVRRLFFTYDDARCYVRKLLRKNGFTGDYSNPLISANGYSIKRLSTFGVF